MTSDAPDANETSTSAAARRRVTKLVVPTAGLGTRFLPATKAVPKEMLPVVDRPSLEYVVEEAASAGIDDVLLVTGRSKRAVEDHFDVSEDLERQLADKGDDERLALVRRSSSLATVHSVRQGIPRGLGHAVLCAAGHVGDEPFVVALPDMLIDGGDALLATMADVRARHGGSVVALYEVPGDEVERYGVAAVEPVEGEPADVGRITGLVEKPPRAEAPSNLAILGRYLLDPAVFDVLRRTEPGRGGEIQLTDAIQELVTSGVGGPVHAVVFRDRVYDTGDKLEYLKAVVRFTSRRDDLGPAFNAWLKEFVAGRDGA